MTAPRLLLRLFLLAAAVASAVALICPAYREVLDEPSPREDPFYYVDYHKRDSYRTRTELVWGWGWPVGLASGLAAGVVGYVLMSRAGTTRRPCDRSHGDRSE
jgi:hypothetical protein